VNWFDKNAPKIFGVLWIALMFLVSIGAVIWAVKWILRLVGVL
jgi:hypothetical protein